MSTAGFGSHPSLGFASPLQFGMELCEAAFDGAAAAAGWSREAMRHASPFGLDCIRAAAGSLFPLSPAETVQFSRAASFLQISAAAGAFSDAAAYHLREAGRLSDALLNSLFGGEGPRLGAYWRGKRQVMDCLAHYPRAIRDIEPKFGFHFERNGCPMVQETARFLLYQVPPRDQAIRPDPRLKPILLIPPYVRGPNILCFLPQSGKSFAHAFADRGIPTYVRVVKDIAENPAVQLMRGEDDALDMQAFCETLFMRHGQPVTVLGYCQGGFISTLNFLSGELSGVADSLITCVAPLDGSRSKGISGFLRMLPESCRGYAGALKTLPNGNQVVDGALMALAFKLKAIGSNNPVSAMYQDLMMVDRADGTAPRLSETACALNYWLLHERADLPPAIIELSNRSYREPISPDGTLPVTLFGRELNLRRLDELGVRMLICYAAKDELVEPEAALAPCEFLAGVRTLCWDKGHVGSATSLCDMNSKTAFHLPGGPAHFHLQEQHG